jgi:hypothetical protein
VGLSIDVCILGAGGELRSVGGGGGTPGYSLEEVDVVSVGTSVYCEFREEWVRLGDREVDLQGVGQCLSSVPGGFVVGTGDFCTQFTCFTSAKVQILTLRIWMCRYGPDAGEG